MARIFLENLKQPTKPDHSYLRRHDDTLQWARGFVFLVMSTQPLSRRVTWEGLQVLNQAQRVGTMTVVVTLRKRPREQAVQTHRKFFLKMARGKVIKSLCPSFAGTLCRAMRLSFNSHS